MSADTGGAGLLDPALEAALAAEAAGELQVVGCEPLRVFSGQSFWPKVLLGKDGVKFPLIAKTRAQLQGGLTLVRGYGRCEPSLLTAGTPIGNTRGV